MRAETLQLCPTLCDPMNYSPPQAPLSMGFSRPVYWSGLSCPPPGDFPNPGIEPVSLMFPALPDGLSTTHATWEAHVTHNGLCVLPLIHQSPSRPHPLSQEERKRGTKGLYESEDRST